MAIPRKSLLVNRSRKVSCWRLLMTVSKSRIQKLNVCLMELNTEGWCCQKRCSSTIEEEKIEFFWIWSRLGWWWWSWWRWWCCDNEKEESCFQVCDNNRWWFWRWLHLKKFGLKSCFDLMASVLVTGWPATWKTWKSQGIWNLPGKVREFHCWSRKMNYVTNLRIISASVKYGKYRIGEIWQIPTFKELQFPLLECFKPGYFNILVIISKYQIISINAWA